ncbi:hypothetical protein MRX96_036489 [Rhipicephalus microplus]
MARQTVAAGLLCTALFLALASTRAGCRAMPVRQAAASTVDTGNTVAAASNCTKDSRAKAICDECIYVTGARESYEPCCANLNRLQEYCEHFLRYSPDSSVNETAARERRRL